MVTRQVGVVDGRFLPGQRPDEIERLMKQARMFYGQGRYAQSLNASDRATQSLGTHLAVSGNELGRYTD
ncbi:MAG: hypothetical protein EHM80_05715 [Nitrospiraceae bacterium]|nr:MAG: hypothetical protein EHM80_05715 [Nitrospiraceae bacterium]